MAQSKIETYQPAKNISELPRVKSLVISEISDRENESDHKSNSVLHKVWFVVFLHGIGTGIGGTALFEVVLKDVESAAEISFFYTIIKSVTSGIDMILYPIRSHYADEFGRKPALYASLFCYLLASIILSIHASLITVGICALILAMFSITWIVIKGILADILPSEPHILSQTIAYTGIISAIGNGIGFIVALGILFSDSYTFIPFTLQCVLELCAIIAVSIIPETLNDNESADESYMVVSDIEFTWNIYKSIKMYLEILRVDDRIKWLTMTTFLVKVSEAGGIGLLTAFLVQVFEWDTVEIAFYFGVFGVAGGLSSLFSGKLIKLMGAPLLMKLSLIWSSIVMAATAFATNVVAIYGIIGLLIPIGFQFFLAKDSYIMSITPSIYQARMNAASNIISNIADLIFANMYSAVFVYFTNRSTTVIYFPGAAILLAAIVRFIAIPVLFRTPIWDIDD